MKAEVKRALDELKARNGNRPLLRAEVIEAARDRNSPLHSYFTWNKDEALRKNLLREAGELIREYHFIVHAPTGEPYKTRHFVSLTSDRAVGGGYRVLTDVLSDDRMREQLLADAMAELEAFQIRYRKLNELASLFVEIDRVAEEYQRTHPRKSRNQERRQQPGAAA